jgi:hypothetical protein
MKQPGLDQRHRDKNGEISRKHGNTLVRTLRRVHGPDSPMGLRKPIHSPTCCKRLTSPRSANWLAIIRPERLKISSSCIAEKKSSSERELPQLSNVGGAMRHVDLHPALVDRIKIIVTKATVTRLLIVAVLLLVQIAWIGFLAWGLLLRHLSPWNGQ